MDISPDQKNVYVAATNTPGVEVLSRNPDTGAVSQLAGTDGCVTSNGNDDGGNAGVCGTASGLDSTGPSYVAVSPDGNNVYVTNGASRTILVFARNGSSGALTQVQCLGPVISPPTGCSSTARMLADLHALVVTPDGAHVYAASGEGGGNGAVLLFNRASDGTLTPPADATRCVTVSGTDGNGDPCEKARALNEPYQLALSPDAKQLYVAASEGDQPNTSDGAVVTLSVQADGSLLQPSGPAGCLSRSGTGDSSDPDACAQGKAAHDLNGVAVSSDGKSVYAASEGSGGGAVEILSRDASTGSLTQDVANSASCLSVNGSNGNGGATGSCDTARGIAETYRITVSPDGGMVYVASQGTNSTNPGAVSVFSRSASGALTQLSGTDGCVSDSAGNDGQGGTTCTPGRALNGAYQLVLSSDCTSAYVASQEAPGLAVFSRRPCLAPLADTNAASNVAAASATLNGTVNPRGTSTSVIFEYGTSTAYGSTTPAQDAGAGNASGPLSAAVSGLLPATTYHYRVVATNSYGRAVGSDQTFTTPPVACGASTAKPTVRITSNQHRGTYRRRERATVRITARSSHGLRTNPSTRRRRISTDRLGRHTFRATAVDACGRSKTSVYSYRVIAAAKKKAARRRARPRFTG